MVRGLMGRGWCACQAADINRDVPALVSGLVNIFEGLHTRMLFRDMVSNL